MAKGISETAFATQVEDLFEIYRWRWTHFRPAWSERGYRTPIRGGDPDGYKGKGFPDYVAVRPPRLIFIELKDKHSKTTPEQDGWLGDLKECQTNVISEPLTLLKGTAIIKLRGKDITFATKPEVYLWRPDDIERIAEVLK